MTYKLRETDAQGTAVPVLVYDDGREQVVDPQQDLYLAWLAEGNTPDTIAYVAPEPYVPSPPSAEAVASMNAMVAAWQAIRSGALANNEDDPGVPANWPAAIAACTAYMDAVSTTTAKQNRQQQCSTALACRVALDDVGVTWSQFLSYIASL